MFAFALALLGGVAAAIGAARQPSKQPGYDPKEAPSVFPRDGKRPGAAPTNDASRGWTIVLAAFRGPQADEFAQRGLEKVRRVAGVSNAFVDKRARSTIVAVGRYADPAAADAQQDLERIRGVVAEGGKPFIRAFLAPPEGTESLGKRPEFNLATVRSQFGKDAKYTLQVGAYGPPNPTAVPTADQKAEAAKAAESAVEQLRREGEQAFYYHGKTFSMVTIGVFGDEALEKFEPVELTQLRRRFPSNLYNGAGVKEFKAGQPVGGLVASKLVKVPEAETAPAAPPAPTKSPSATPSTGPKSPAKPTR